MVRVFSNAFAYGSFTGGGTVCFVNDNGAAGFGVGFLLVPDADGGLSGTFASPYGYKPIGSVSIYCQSGTFTAFLLAARAW
jgi:hypothetical protein